MHPAEKNRGNLHVMISAGGPIRGQVRYVLREYLQGGVTMSELDYQLSVFRGV
ncbi:hypothetical protein BDW67DRAFT_181602 [Aspergillus spinulosporus]